MAFIARHRMLLLSLALMASALGVVVSHGSDVAEAAAPGAAVATAQPVNRSVEEAAPTVLLGESGRIEDDCGDQRCVYDWDDDGLTITASR
jgi:hypothetical protein